MCELCDSQKKKSELLQDTTDSFRHLTNMYYGVQKGEVDLHDKEAWNKYRMEAELVLRAIANQFLT